MRRFPLTLVLALLLLAYAAGFASPKLWEPVRGYLVRSGASIPAVAGAAAIGFLVGRWPPARIVVKAGLTGLAVAILLLTWSGSLFPKPNEGRTPALEIQGRDVRCGQVGTYSTDSLGVRAVGRDGRGLGGVQVRYRLIDGPGRLLFEDRTTHPDGGCETWLRPEGPPGRRLVQASLTDRPEVSVLFAVDAH
jgi:hypothetical protein